ncbi:ATP-dependent Clp protease ATP-binding subunit [Candidatus Dependentiae bacterium]|nr:ATP-dependent Clp protease ATP-binding subunit [Candidatus Dependentiae bacterium]
MEVFRSRKEIINSLTENVSNIFNEGKTLAIKYGGVLLDLHLIYAILEKVKNSSPETRKGFRELKTELEKLKNKNKVLSVPKATQKILNSAIDLAQAEGKKRAELRHLIEALRIDSTAAKKYTKYCKPNEVNKTINEQKKKDSALPGSARLILDRLGTNLTEEVLQPGHLPVIGREAEIEAVLETLCRYIKNNPLIIGRAGVGKTALVKAVAEQIAKGNVPSRLKGKIIYEVNRNLLLSGVKYIGDIERQMRDLIKAVDETDGKVILFFDEIHTLFAAGGMEGKGDVANLIKSALGNNKITVIGATTSEEYYRHFQKDEALTRRFNALLLNEPSIEMLKEILFKIKSEFEDFHQLKIGKELIPEIIRMSKMFIPQRAFPDKAIDLLDRSCAKASTKGKKKLELKTVRKTIATITGLPLKLLEKDLRNYYVKLPKFLKTKVFGQSEAIEKVSRIIKLTKLELDPNPERPDGIFLFYGPPGVGKYELAQGLAKYLYGSELKIKTFDLSEYTQEHYIAQLIGSPPGYIGYGERGLLVKTVADNPHSLLIFKNVENTHVSIINFLKQAFSSGKFVDASGMEHFLSTITIVFIYSAFSGKTSKKLVGFIQSEDEFNQEKTSFPYNLVSLMSIFDELVEFKPLDKKAIEEIIKTKLMTLKSKIKKDFKTELEIDSHFVGTLAENAFKSKAFGSFVNDFIKKKLTIPLIDFIIEHEEKKLIKVILNKKDVEFK